MLRFILPVLFVAMLVTTGCTQPTKKVERAVGGPCEDCELMFDGMPQNVLWQTKIAGPDEPGERLIIRGTIYKADGKTPAPNVILYVYQTDNTGKYSPAPKQTQAKRHGHLRGWMKTDTQGRYEFSTIRPAAYPSRKDPQHIHPIIKESDTSLYWIDDFLFSDDPLVTNEVKLHQENRGGSGIVNLVKKNGVWIGERNIILGLNVSGYNYQR